jgi:hypothetical protein
MSSEPRDCVRIFLVGGAALLLEVLLTRIAAVTLFANLAFGVIALSILGLSIGSGLAARNSSITDAARERSLRCALVVGAGFALLAALLSTWLPLIPDQLSRGGEIAGSFLQRRKAFEVNPGQARWTLIGLLCIVQMVPFCAAGYAQAVLLASASRRVSRLYAADLVGSTCGALLALPLLRWCGGADGIGCVALMLVAASACGEATKIAGRERDVHLGVAALGLATLLFSPFAIRHAAGFSEDSIVAVDWSALARIGLYDENGKNGGLRRSMLVVDNTSATDVAFARDRSFGQNLERIPYLLRPRGDVLVIGAGGGQEIETALATAPNRERNVDAVELAAGEERLLRRYFGARPDFLLDQPGVRYTIGDGRSYLEMSGRRWDVIEMKEVNFHSFAGQASSAWTPNLLFTAEGMQTELDHLGDEGLLAINRGLYGGGELESTLQLLITLRRATDRLSLDLAPRLVIVDRPRQKGVQRMCLVSRRPFTGAELDSIESISAASGLSVVRTPRAPDAPLENALSAPYEDVVREVYAQHHLVIEAATDDRPFGYEHLPFREALLGRSSSEESPHARLQRADFRFLTGALLLLFVLTTGVVATSARHVPPPRRGTAMAVLVACCLLGAGFMLCEVVLVERASLLLGHPTIGFVVVLTSMLLGLGIGSVVSARIVDASPVRAVAAAVTAVAAVASLVRLSILETPLRQYVSSELRPWILGAVLLMLAVPLGVLLPSLLRLASRTASATIEGCWSANGAASVFGTITAALFVRTVGFAFTGGLACACYATAVVIWLAVLGTAAQHRHQA